MYSATVDHYWLLTAMSGGLPALVTLHFCNSRSPPHVMPWRPFERSYPTIVNAATHGRRAVLALFFLGTTVAFWRELEVFFTFCLGSGAWLIDGHHKPVDDKSSGAPHHKTRMFQPRRPIAD